MVGNNIRVLEAVALERVNARACVVPKSEASFDRGGVESLALGLE